MDLIVTAHHLFTPIERIEHPLVFVEDGKIVEVVSREGREVSRGTRLLDLGDACLVPGFIDVHIHGGSGADVMESDPTALRAVEQLLYRHGVTSYLPTTITAPLDET